MREYEVYHDEYKGKGGDEYWHGILFLPVDKKEEIVNLLQQIRIEHKYDKYSDIKFAGTLNNPSKKSSRVVKNNLDLFQHLVLSKSSTKEDPVITTNLINRSGKDVYEGKCEPYISITGTYGCKFVLFHVPDNHKELSKYPMFKYSD